MLSRLPELANKSIQNHRHGAILLKNGTPISWGFNVIRGNTTWHAEGDAIRRYLLSQGILNYEKQQSILRKERKW
jgi:hypothetical protein